MPGRPDGPRSDWLAPRFREGACPSRNQQSPPWSGSCGRGEKRWAGERIHGARPPFSQLLYLLPSFSRPVGFLLNVAEPDRRPTSLSWTFLAIEANCPSSMHRMEHHLEQEPPSSSPRSAPPVSSSSMASCRRSSSTGEALVGLLAVRAGRAPSRMRTLEPLRRLVRWSGATLGQDRHTL